MGRLKLGRMENSRCSVCGLAYGCTKGVKVIDLVPSENAGEYLTTLYCSRCDRTWKVVQFSLQPSQVLSTPAGGAQVPEYRWLWEHYNGPIPEGSLIHHLNGIHSDNRIENLVCITTLEHGNNHSGQGKFYTKKSDLIIKAQQERIRQLESKLFDKREVLS